MSMRMFCRGHYRAVVLAFVVIAMVVLGYGTKAYAAPGDLDPSFDKDGRLTTDFAANRYTVGEGVALQDDGKIVVAGDAYTGASTGYDFALARYNPNGSLDTTFGTGGKVTTPIGSGSVADRVTDVAIRADGKIVVAGYTYNGANNDFAVARYNPDGSLDTTFSGDGKSVPYLGPDEDVAYGVAVQGTKTVVVGSSYQGDPYSDSDPGTAFDFAVVRYLDNGELDTTFSDDGKTTLAWSSGDEDSQGARSITLQPDGKIVVAGISDIHDPGDKWTISNFALVRYNPDGSLDSEFDGDGMLSTNFPLGSDSSSPYSVDGAEAVVIQPDGKIVAAGYSSYDFALARYNPDGSLDTTFSGDGMRTTDFLRPSYYNDHALDVALQKDGKIVAAGWSGGGFAVARYYGGSDNTPPRVSNWTPTGKRVSPTAKVYATFSEKMSESSVEKPGTFTLKKGTTAVAAKVTYNSTTKKATLNPNRNLRSGATYRARVSSGAKDLTGNALAAKSWMFTVRR